MKGCFISANFYKRKAAVFIRSKRNFIGEKFPIFKDTKDIILSGQSMAVAEYSYDGKFEGYILIVGQTGCGKTIFIQNIAKKT